LKLIQHDNSTGGNQYQGFHGSKMLSPLI
jgi:hypothetical protein